MSGRSQRQRTGLKRAAEEEPEKAAMCSKDAAEEDEANEAGEDEEEEEEEAGFNSSSSSSSEESRGDRARRTAKEGRARKKQYIEQLETKLVIMESRDSSLRDEVERNQRLLATLVSKHSSLLLN